MKKIFIIFIISISAVISPNIAAAFEKSVEDSMRIVEKYCLIGGSGIDCKNYSLDCTIKGDAKRDEMQTEIKNNCLLVNEERERTKFKPIIKSTEKKQDLVDKNEKIVSSESLDTKTEDKQNILQRTGNNIGGGLKSVGSAIGNTFKSDKKKLAEATQVATDTEKQALEEFNTSVQIAKSEFERKIGI